MPRSRSQNNELWSPDCVPGRRCLAPCYPANKGLGTVTLNPAVQTLPGVTLPQGKRGTCTGGPRTQLWGTR